MIRVSKEEKDALLSEMPKTLVCRTSKQKSKRHTYYVEETPQILRMLKVIRGK